jgi:type I restriction enzyme S subunit
MSKWRNVKIGDVAKQKKGSITIQDDVDYKLCRVQLHRKGVVLRETVKGSKIKTKKQQLCHKGDLVVAEMDAKFGGYGFIDTNLDGAIVSSHYYLYEFDTKQILRDYFTVLIHSGLIQNQIEAKGSTNYSSIRASEFLNYTIPLPELKTQESIAKRFLKVYNGKNELNDQNSKQLELIALIRQSILEEAVEGKLTAEWRREHHELISGDDHASKLLEKIQAEKERIINDDKKRRGKFSPILNNEKPFDSPEGWVWCRLGDICDIKRGVNPQYCEMSDYSILNQKCVRWNQIERQWAKPVIPKWFQGIDKNSLTHLNDVLVNSTGEGTIGRAGLVRSSEIGLPFDTHVLRVSTFDGVISSFLMYFINSFHGQNQISQSKGAKTTKQTELGVNNLRSLLIPLPPSTEQEAIVGKIEELLVNIEKLEKQISERKDLSEMLMQSVLREAFSTS